MDRGFRVKKSTLTTVIAAIMLYHISFISIGSTYFPRYLTFVLFSILCVSGYVFVNFRILLRKKYRWITLTTLLLGALMFYSSYLNRGRWSWSFATPFVNIMKYMLPVLFFMCIDGKKKVNEVVKTIYLCTLFYCVFTDIHGLLVGAKQAGSIGVYLIGNKFSLTFVHMYLVAFYWYFYARKRDLKHRTLLFVQWAYALAISVYVECSSSAVACVIMGVLLLYEEKMRERLSKRWVPFVTLAVSDLILLVNSSIITYKPVAYFIENILGKDLSLTGRLRGYAALTEALRVSPLFGVGQENNYGISSMFTGMADLQNGMADLLLSFGIIGTSVFMMLMYQCLKRKSTYETYAMLIMIYIFILLSSIEITLNVRMVTMLAMYAFCRFDNTSSLGE